MSVDPAAPADPAPTGAATGAASGAAPDSGAGPPPEIASFVLRFTQDRWQEPAGRQRARWRGQIRHVQSDAEARFTDFSDAVAFMQAELARRTLASVEEAAEVDRASVLRESLRIWERVAGDYAEAVSGVVQEGLGRSERYQRQAMQLFEQTLGAWAPWLAPGKGRGASSEQGAGAGVRARESEPPGPAEPGPAADASLAAIAARLDALTRAVEALAARLDGDEAAG